MVAQSRKTTYTTDKSVTMDTVYFPTGLETEVTHVMFSIQIPYNYYIIHKKIPSVSRARMSVTIDTSAVQIC